MGKPKRNCITGGKLDYSKLTKDLTKEGLEEVFSKFFNIHQKLSGQVKSTDLGDGFTEIRAKGFMAIIPTKTWRSMLLEKMKESLEGNK